MSDLNFGGGGSSSSGSGSTTTIIILLAVCCCCSLSIGVPIGFYFLDPTFKDWVNGLFNKNNSTTAAADTGGGTGPTPTGVPCGDGVTYAATAALCPTSGPSGTTGGKWYAPTLPPSDTAKCKALKTYDKSIKSKPIQFDAMTCAGMCAFDGSTRYQSQYTNRNSHLNSYNWVSLAPDAPKCPLVVTSPNVETDNTNYEWVCPEPMADGSTWAFDGQITGGKKGAHCVNSISNASVSSGHLPKDAIAGQQYKVMNQQNNPLQNFSSEMVGLTYAACGSKTNPCDKHILDHMKKPHA